MRASTFGLARGAATAQRVSAEHGSPRHTKKAHGRGAKFDCSAEMLDTHWHDARELKHNMCMVLEWLLSSSRLFQIAWNSYVLSASASSDESPIVVGSNGRLASAVGARVSVIVGSCVGSRREVRGGRGGPRDPAGRRDSWPRAIPRRCNEKILRENECLLLEDLVQSCVQGKGGK